MNSNCTHSIFERLLAFLNGLEQQSIFYELAHNRDEALMVTIVLPGQRWEVEFLTDGSIEVEKFVSSGEIYDEAILAQIGAIETGADAKTVDEPSRVLAHNELAS